MDVDEFIKQESPTGKRSRLLPYREPIFILKNAGYSQVQIRKWLKLNNFVISVEGLRDFIKTQEKIILSNPSLMTIDNLNHKLSNPLIKVVETSPIKQPDVASTKPSPTLTAKPNSEKFIDNFFDQTKTRQNLLGKFNTTEIKENK